MDKYKLIEEATKFFELKQDKFGNWQGLLCPQSRGIFAYGRAALGVYSVIKEDRSSGLWTAFGCIYSIDDAGVTLHHPMEKEVKAEARRDTFAMWIKSLNYMAPTAEQVEAYCKQHRATACYW